MKTRLNPWLATTDLFSSLAAATFGALMLYIPYSLDTQRKLQVEATQCGRAFEDRGRKIEECNAQRDRMTRLQEVATRLRESVARELRETPGARQPRSCGEDLCLDVDIRFALNRADIEPEYRDGLRKTAQDVHKALGRFSTAVRQTVELTIEGHTDQTVPAKGDDRERFLYNWRLSSERASSVLHLFHAEGLRAPEYRIIALGYADSERLQPDCRLNDDGCNRLNRRTTFRIRVDTRKLEQQLGQQRVFQ